MKRSSAGFSMVEVVLTLGVIGFALLAIIGLLPIGLQSGRASIQETRANHLAEKIFSTLRSQPFNTVSLSQLSNNTTVNLALQNTASGATGTQLHAKYDGTFVSGSDYFTIEVRFRNTPDGVELGTANEVHLKVTSRETGTLAMYYATIIAAQ